MECKGIHLDSTLVSKDRMVYICFFFQLVALISAHLRIPRMVWLLSQFNFTLIPFYLCQDLYLYEHPIIYGSAELPLGTVAEIESSDTQLVPQRITWLGKTPAHLLSECCVSSRVRGETSVLFPHLERCFYRLSPP